MVGDTETHSLAERRIAGGTGRGRPSRRLRTGLALIVLACSHPWPAGADGGLSDFQLSVLERKLATMREPHRAPLDLEPPEPAEGTVKGRGTPVFAKQIAAGDWTAVGARVTRAVAEAVAAHRDALFRGSADAGASGATASPARVGPFREQSRFFLVERVLPPAVVSEAERLGPLAVRVWVTPERQDALELFHLRSGGAVPPPRERPTPPPDERFEHGGGGPAGAEQHYRLRAHPPGDPPLYAGDPAAGGDRLGIQRDNVLIEAGRDTYTRSEDDSRWRTSGMGADDERLLAALIEAIADRLWNATNETNDPSVAGRGRRPGGQR